MIHPTNRPAEPNASARSPSGDYLLAVFEYLPDGLLLLDSNQVILAANRAFCQDILGITVQQVVGQRYVQLFTTRLSEHEIVEERHLHTGMRRMMAIDRHGQSRWYGVERFSVGQSTDQQIERWSDLSIQRPQLDRLLMQERHIWMSRLAASIAHEIGNPLQSIRSCLDLSAEDSQLQPETREYIELAQEELNRLAVLLVQLRELYRSSYHEGLDIELEQLITAARIRQ